MTRAPVDTIVAPAFLPLLRWLNTKPLRMDLIVDDGPVLIEFWDCCRPNSLRTLPYLKAWNARYGERPGEAARAGGAKLGTHARPGGKLTVIGIHSPGFPPGRDPETVAAAVERLGIDYPVLLDGDLEMWREYENAGWPARYLFDRRGRLFEYHYGEGDYAETERAIQELLGVELEPIPVQRPEDEPGALLRPQSEDRDGPYSGAYEAGGVWLVMEGSGTVIASSEPLRQPLRTNVSPDPIRRELSVTGAGAYPLFEHDRHAEAILTLELSPGLICHATCFTPGLS